MLHKKPLRPASSKRNVPPLVLIKAFWLADMNFQVQPPGQHQLQKNPKLCALATPSYSFPLCLHIGLIMEGQVQARPAMTGIQDTSQTPRLRRTHIDFWGWHRFVFFVKMIIFSAAYDRIDALKNHPAMEVLLKFDVFMDLA